MSQTPSPCILVCKLTADNVCRGCGRTLEEIGGWPLMDDSDQRRILDQLPARLKKMEEKGITTGENAAKS
jgi:hypothetical protein